MRGLAEEAEQTRPSSLYSEPDLLAVMGRKGIGFRAKGLGSLVLGVQGFVGFRVEVLGFKEFRPRAGAEGMLFFFKGVFCCQP